VAAFRYFRATASICDPLPPPHPSSRPHTILRLYIESRARPSEKDGSGAVVAGEPWHLPSCEPPAARVHPRLLHRGSPPVGRAPSFAPAPPLDTGSPRFGFCIARRNSFFRASRQLPFPLPSPLLPHHRPPLASASLHHVVFSQWVLPMFRWDLHEANSLCTWLCPLCRKIHLPWGTILVSNPNFNGELPARDLPILHSHPPPPPHRPRGDRIVAITPVGVCHRGGGLFERVRPLMLNKWSVPLMFFFEIYRF